MQLWFQEFDPESLVPPRKRPRVPGADAGESGSSSAAAAADGFIPMALDDTRIAPPATNDESAPSPATGSGGSPAMPVNERLARLSREELEEAALPAEPDPANFVPMLEDNRGLPKTLDEVNVFVTAIATKLAVNMPRGNSMGARGRLRAKKASAEEIAATTAVTKAAAGIKKGAAAARKRKREGEAEDADEPEAAMEDDAASSATSSSHPVALPNVPVAQSETHVAFDLTSLTDYQATMLAGAIIRAVDEKLSTHAYAVRDDGGAEITLQVGAENVPLLMELGTPILRNLVHANVAMMEFCASRSTDLTADRKQANVALGLLSAAGVDEKDPQNCNYPRLVKKKFYFPLRMPVVLLDKEWTTKLFFSKKAGASAGGDAEMKDNGDGEVWTGEQLPRNFGPIYRFRYHDHDSGSLVSASSRIYFAGNSGAHDLGRADPATDGVYYWDGTNTDVALAVGFDPERKGPPPAARSGGSAANPGSGSASGSASSPGVGPLDAGLPIDPIFTEYETGHAGLRYWKEWRDPNADKRNQPTLTLPQPPFRFDRPLPDDGATGSGTAMEDVPGPAAASPAAASVIAAHARPTMAEKLRSLALLRTKRKGDWNTGRGGVALLNGRVEHRGGAGAAMAAGFAAAGLPPEPSATLWAKWAVQNDDDGKVAWRVLSDGVRGRRGLSQADLAQETLKLRTAQNWCHLIGQGDGGIEDYYNLVGGSEHANTEQLAIENAQRDFDGLVAKVTAYLLPTTVTERRADFMASERAQLEDWGVPGAGSIPYAQFRFLVLDKTGAVPTGAALIEMARNAGLSAALLTAISEPGNSGVSALRTFTQTLSAMFFLPLPIAVAIRYKIYGKKANDGDAEETTALLFDHLIDAQRESFDIFQFNLLYWKARLNIARNLDALHGFAADSQSSFVRTVTESLAKSRDRRNKVWTERAQRAAAADAAAKAKADAAKAKADADADGSRMEQ